MSTPPEVIAARKLNQAKYALEDFDDGVKDLTKIPLVFGMLALFLGLSLVFSANNLDHLAFTVLGGVALSFAARYDYLPFSNLAILTAGFAGLLAAEAALFGLPDLLLPFLNAADYRGFPVLLNHLTPYLYWGLKVVSGFYLLRLFWLRNKVYAQPEELLRKAAGNRVV